MLVAVCLLLLAMVLLSLVVVVGAVALGAATIAIVVVVVGVANATGHKPPPRWHRAAPTVVPGRAQLRHSEGQLPMCMLSV